MTAILEKVNGSAVTDEPRPADPRAEAEAEAIRVKAAAEADAIRTKAREEAEKQRLVNERARMKLEKEQAAHAAYIAEKAAKESVAKAVKEKAEKAEADEAEREAAQLAEQQRSERFWKWGARGIYAVGLIIAAPVQFMHFWDPKRPFLVAAPGLLEGLALVLAFGAAWAVAHRRDVAPYRVGIMFGALIAAAINLYGGLSDARIGFNAGLIGAIASLGGPIVLMAYEHGIAQKADGTPSRRERRSAEKAAAAKAAAEAKAKADKEAAEARATDEKTAQKRQAEEEQQRRDDDRRQNHPDVWEIADAMRSARGCATVTEQIWAEAWYRATGSKTVGVTPEMEAQSRAAQARMKTVTEMPILGAFSQIESQMGRRAKRDPNTPDGRRFNGGTPPRRTAGDTQPYSEGAKKQAAHEQTSTAPRRAARTETEA